MRRMFRLTGSFFYYVALVACLFWRALSDGSRRLDVSEVVFLYKLDQLIDRIQDIRSTRLTRKELARHLHALVVDKRIKHSDVLNDFITSEQCADITEILGIKVNNDPSTTKSSKKLELTPLAHSKITLLEYFLKDMTNDYDDIAERQRQNDSKINHNSDVSLVIGAYKSPRETLSLTPKLLPAYQNWKKVYKSKRFWHIRLKDTKSKAVLHDSVIKLPVLATFHDLLLELNRLNIQNTDDYELRLLHKSELLPLSSFRLTSYLLEVGSIPPTLNIIVISRTR